MSENVVQRRTNVVVVVETEEPISRDLVSHPVKVSVDRTGARPLDGLIAVAEASRGNAPALAAAPEKKEENVEAEH